MGPPDTHDDLVFSFLCCGGPPGPQTGPAGGPLDGYRMGRWRQRVEVGIRGGAISSSEAPEDALGDPFPAGGDHSGSQRSAETEAAWLALPEGSCRGRSYKAEDGPRRLFGVRTIAATHAVSIPASVLSKSPPTIQLTGGERFGRDRVAKSYRLSEHQA